MKIIYGTGSQVNCGRNGWGVTEAMFTRGRIQTDPVRKSNLIDLLFTRYRFETSPKRIQNWTYITAGPIWDPFGSVPDRFQNGPV